MLNMRWLVISGFLFLVLSFGDALECFTCSSHVGIPNSMNECEIFNYYQNHHKSVCMAGDQVCAKYVVNHEGMIWVHRSCKQYDICALLSSVYSNGRDQLLECSTCSDRNLCNSALSFHESMGLVSTMIVLKAIIVG